jgi:multimeric flavodoxin WrbA
MEKAVPSAEDTTTRVLGIVGSPRRSGNTEVLVDEVLRAAEEAGAQTDKVILNELNISPCQACNACRDNGVCVQQDDMAPLLERLQDNQVWVLGTPVYWWGPTGQFKAFLDRWYGARNVTFRGRRVILVIPLGGSERYAQHTVGMLTDTLDYLGTDLLATVLAPGASGRGAVRGHTGVMAAARRAGREAIGPSAGS